MTPEELRRHVAKVARGLAAADVLPDEALGGPPAGNLFTPAPPRRTGMPADWTSPIAIRWAGTLGIGARELAVTLAEGIAEKKWAAAVEVAPDGMLTVTLSDAARSEIIDTILHDRAGYGVPSGHDLPVPRQEKAPGQKDGGEDEEVGGIGPVSELRLLLAVDPPVNPAPDDPVAPIQLAYARLRRIIRNAEAAGVRSRKKDRHEELVHPTERVLLVTLADTPRRMSKHVVDRDGQTRALLDLAERADAWTQPTRPTHPEEPLTRLHGSRLALARATCVVLRNGLAQIGIVAPERM